MDQKGGDEINIISLDEVKNYGWPISFLWCSL
ncbi:hypothetical protein CM15mP35_02160 [bacterium]|nr:MAG: hypothetical protein CM15mP35_02160 [bacterium]